MKQTDPASITRWILPAVIGTAAFVGFIHYGATPLVPTIAAFAALAGFTIAGYALTIESIERLRMSTQSAIDAVVAQLTKAHTELADQLEAATLGIQAQLVDAGVADTVDLSALAALAQKLDDLVPDAEVDEAVEDDEDDDDDEVEVDEDDEVLAGIGEGDDEAVAVDEAVEDDDDK